jgi:hypothetical protein
MEVKWKTSSLTRRMGLTLVAADPATTLSDKTKKGIHVDRKL